jgi:hypothetical protein
MPVDQPVPVATCVWRISDALIVALDDLFGEPVDAYVNGSQVWLREDGPGGAMLEWRLHPVGGYVKPKGMATAQVFSSVALALAQSLTQPTPAPESPSVNDKRTEGVRSTDGHVALSASALWDGLEAFAAYDDDFAPQQLHDAVMASLGLTPDAFGVVDHEQIGDAWEAAEGKLSVIENLLRQLTGP